MFAGSSSSAISIEIFGDVRQVLLRAAASSAGIASSRAITERHALRQRREVALHDQVDAR